MRARNQAGVCALAALLVLGACATPRYQYVKAGAGAEEFEAAKGACIEHTNRTVNAYADYSLPPFGGNSTGNNMNRKRMQRRAFTACMRSRGFEREEL